MRLKVGELAKRAGLTVRTLHHYDRLGLLKPSVRSESGYRLYGQNDLHRLQQILSLRQLDIPLEEIRQVLDAGTLTTASLLAAQLTRVDAEISRQMQLRGELLRIQEALALDGEPSEAACLRTLEAISVYRRYLGDEARALPLLGSGGKLAASWQLRIDTMRALFEQNQPAHGARARTAARHWFAQVEKDTRSRAAMFVRLDHLFAEQGPALPHTGVTPALGEYILQAFSEYRLSIYRKYLAPSDYRHLRRRYARVMRRWPALLGELESHLAAGNAPGHSAVQGLAQAWLSMRRELAGSDAAMAAMRQAEDNEAELRVGTWLHPRLLAYLKHAVAAALAQAE
ncbi:MerR family transcriptional regulator [Cupriavidus alkaliphilus]|uniref:MerR family transcriptional regulator n=1 Tax=Cupriavidus alkaliphilus TaxID=942866 RepID=UPI000DE77FC8|nr:MerR family transcriptional regulator [Cupriavidus alkaliphilus]PVY69132.1 MerR family transcriptional regulator [Cupriavidus alkaliphilus]